jgi:hypothetical protein
MDHNLTDTDFISELTKLLQENKPTHVYPYEKTRNELMDIMSMHNNNVDPIVSRLVEDGKLMTRKAIAKNGKETTLYFTQADKDKYEKEKLTTSACHTGA